MMISFIERSTLRLSPSCIPRVWPLRGQTLARMTGEEVMRSVRRLLGERQHQLERFLAGQALLLGIGDPLVPHRLARRRDQLVARPASESVDMGRVVIGGARRLVLGYAEVG